MTERKALLVAPLVIFPVALAFLVARAWLDSSPRDLLVSPLSAFVIAAVGYPLAVGVGWLWLRVLPKSLSGNLGFGVGVGTVSAEAVFWLGIHPFWHRDFSIAFCAALLAASGAAVAVARYHLRATENPD